MDHGLKKYDGGDQTMNSKVQKRLEEAYTLYPRHLGKSRGMNIARLQCKTEEKIIQLEKAIKNYIKHLQQEGTGAQYIMYFSTFMAQWRDWLDPEHGKVTIKTQELDLSHIEWDPE